MTGTVGDGHWVVLFTGQGGGLPDTVYGPLFDRDEAIAYAEQQTAASRALGRRDSYQAGYVETDPEQWL